MQSYKVVITGPFNAGKTVFIKTASDIDIVTTERKITDPSLSGVKKETTVAMDYGQKRMDQVVFHLHGTPGQERFEFMWKILAREMNAFILLVDSADKGSLMDAKQIMRLFLKQSKVPYLVVANKQDLRGAMAPKKIANLLALPKDVPVVPCVAQDPASVDQVFVIVRQLLSI
jgi:hypothetical protein